MMPKIYYINNDLIMFVSDEVEDNGGAKLFYGENLENTINVSDIITEGLSEKGTIEFSSSTYNSSHKNGGANKGILPLTIHYEVDKDCYEPIVLVNLKTSPWSYGIIDEYAHVNVANPTISKDGTKMMVRIMLGKNKEDFLKIYKLNI